VFTITPFVQSYGWGSGTALQEILDLPDEPLIAEAWFGAHPLAPSRAPDSSRARLDELIAADPQRMLGEDVAARYTGRLPFLLKLIAAERPLSLQVHPNVERAREGFAQEELARIPRDAPRRNYRDTNHKPELVLALTQFDAVCGFRTPRRAAEVLAGLRVGLADELRAALRADPTPVGVRAVFTRLVTPGQRPSPAEVGELAQACIRRLSAGSPSPRADRTVELLQGEYPGDPGVVASLLLNPVTLQPGEALFIPAGGVHAYLHGLGVEIMASSDNVLRAGLTHKHVDVAEMLRNVDYVAAPPIRIAPELSHGSSRVFYAPVDDFELSVTDVDCLDPQPLPEGGPRVLVCVRGEVTVSGRGGELELGRGQAAFVPASDGLLTVRGTGSLVQGAVP
jgi:mannose-6-phosphate isomerase